MNMQYYNAVVEMEKAGVDAEFRARLARWLPAQPDA